MKGQIFLVLLCAAIVAAKGLRNLSKTEETIELNEIGCPIDASIEKLIPHENCNQFYQCWAGSLVPHTCPSQLHYNPETWQCDYPDQVNCGERIIPDSQKNAAKVVVTDNNPITDTVQIIDALDEDKVQVIEFEDEVHEYEGGDTVQVTDGEESVETESEEEVSVVESNEESNAVSTETCKEGAHIVPHENCNQFYICAHGTPVAMSCPGELLFNPEHEVCDWPRAVTCGDRIIPESTEAASSEEIQTPASSSEETDETNEGADVVSTASPITTEATVDEESNGDHVSIVDTPEEADEEDGSQSERVCELRGFDGHAFPHEYCNQFYLCADGTGTPMFCSSSLLFNPETSQCDWPENVDCGDRTLLAVPGKQL